MGAKRLLSKADFATEAGVSRAAVTKAAKGLLLAAIVAGEIDIDHPDAIAYLKKKQAAKTKTPPKNKPAAKAATHGAATGETSHYSKDGPIQLVLDLTIRELVEAFGTDKQFSTWIDARKVIEDIRYKQLRTAKEEGILIPRELVKLHIFGAIEAANVRLLSDTPKTLSERIFALAKAGGSKKEAEKIIKEIIGSQLKNVKTTATRVLKQ